jgi:hypothetical protein
MKHKVYLTFDNRFILFHGYYILKSYNGYIAESSKFQKKQHYSVLWSKQEIYLNIAVAQDIYVTEAVTEPVIEPLVEPVTEPVTEPVIEPLVEPVTEPLVEPVLEPVTEPVTEPLVEPVIEDEMIDKSDE